MLACGALLLSAALGAVTPPQPPPVGAVKSRLVSALSGGMRDPVLASPLSGAPLLRDRRVYGRTVDMRYREEAGADGAEARVYRDNGVFVDLTPSSARAPAFSFDEIGASLMAAVSSLADGDKLIGTTLFQSPAVSFLYERGWRQQFNVNGFPGIDKEFVEVDAFFAPLATDDVVLDMSCGSGLMTRRLVASKRYARVLAGDYSEAMLVETARRFREEGVRPPELVRCDVGALPFQTASIAAAHAGAALHCWPDAEGGLCEIRRVLKPGGAFFATTFLTSANIGTRRIDASGKRVAGAGFRLFELDELRTMLRDAGFDESSIDVRQEGRACAVCKAHAPSA